MNNRWWIYQRERFPVLAHGPMVIVFCLSVMLFSSLQEGGFPDILRIAGAVITTVILFFQLRVADEFKDFADDSKYRPGRPVPRGLISLKELARVAWIGAVVQFAIAIYIDIGLVPILILVWTYLGLMTKEFFVANWLKKTPSVYLISHMLIMPLIAFYVSAFDWLCECRAMPTGLGWLLLFAFGCGLVLEIGRKIKSPDAERDGVEIYSSLWGIGIALSAWTAACALAVAAFVRAAAFYGDTNLAINSGIGVLGPNRRKSALV
ncbi:MAG: UbiA family prenyltransferase [Proteobacteria bacterium]|nr:UbiA family prenyltransferase [Pseudomonadota bacterium]